MKVVIIGGGVAGLTLGIFLSQKQIEVVVNERLPEMPLSGHAFLMHSDALSVLKDVNPDSKEALLGHMVNTFSLRRPSGKEIMHLQLDSWKCIKRYDLIRFLHSNLQPSQVRTGRDFSHFIYQENKVTAVAFKNGEIEYGDIFVGADGANSKVRNALFGKVNFTPIAVKEIVGMVKNEKLAKFASDSFTKFQDNTRGLAFGFIPTSAEEIVWFIQYDARTNDIFDNTPEELKSFCQDILKSFPQVVQDILCVNDFSTSYIWNTRDMDLLPSFHKNNVVLMGDAAHLSLPFTSAGTTNAILDAKVIADVITKDDEPERAFEIYYETRYKEVAKHTDLGRKLKNIFLNPHQFKDDNIPLPLMAQKDNNLIHIKRKPIQVLYFTDPICSTCWIIQPLLLKLKLEYDDYLDMKYLMGGMLPSWEEYTKGKISNPSDAAKHWDEVSAAHEMPLNGDIWIEDPLTSSYPPSIAFKAAQMQDNYLALLFLRRIKEMVFVEKKNIIKWEFLEKAAYESGLDTARLLRDFKGRARSLFSEDLVKGKELGIKSFPTLIFSDKENNTITLKGYQPYEIIEAIIKKIVPNSEKQVINTDPQNLFDFYPTMAEKEFAYLSNLSKEQAKKTLNQLFDQGKVEKYESKNGTLWKSRFNVPTW